MKKRRKPFETSESANRSSKKRSNGRATEASPDEKSVGFFADPGVRETIESIVVAVILALLFRAYEAEAFVIPTGSMAPTLQGRHVDIFCHECGYNFRVGASEENPDRLRKVNQNGKVIVDPNSHYITENATCPICRHTHDLDRNMTGWKSNDDSFYGDRIIVSKFAYELSDPKRWDVIVFKYPGNPKQNYIKRLIGLPGETIKLEFGDVLVRNESGGFDVVSKPHHKLKAMLQKVDDTHHIAKTLKKVGWPSRWNEWSQESDARKWSIDQEGKHPQFVLSNSEDTRWLRYRHIIPRETDWRTFLSNGQLPPRLQEFRGQLITDFYSYNCFYPNRTKDPFTIEDLMSPYNNEDGRYLTSKFGLHWVKDLALECQVNVDSKSGQLILDIVQSGDHFYCTINVETGEATLSCSSDDVSFVSSDATASNVSGSTPIRGQGKYRIRYANVDNRLYLWVNEKVIRFDGPTEFVHHQRRFPAPRYSTDDPGDAEPVGVGGKGVDLTVNRLKVLRDIYYINSRSNRFVTEYQNLSTQSQNLAMAEQNALLLRRIFEDPQSWESRESEAVFADLIHDHSGYYYDLDENQFMPLGDNSPSSQDARAWAHGHFFDRKFLIGKALFIYWPHAWRKPFFIPNFRRMSFIR